MRAMQARGRPAGRSKRTPARGAARAPTRIKRKHARACLISASDCEVELGDLSNDLHACAEAVGVSVATLDRDVVSASQLR
jgi:hypothetical protein